MKGNPGKSIYWSVARRLLNGKKEFYARYKKGAQDETTNNQAEFRALIDALKYVLELPDEDHITIHMDSDLVVAAMHKRKKIRAWHLYKLYTEATGLYTKIQKHRRYIVSIQWVPRDRIVAVLGH